VKKSAAVPASFCASVAALILSGCSSPVSVRRCVDPTSGTILPDIACTSPVTASTYRGGRYARVPTNTGSVCIDTTTNMPASDFNCRMSTGYYPGYYYGSHYYGRPSWGYGGAMNGGRISNFSSSPPSGAEIRSSTGSTISRGGFGSSGSGGSSGG
jgi:hypothetical protein